MKGIDRINALPDELILKIFLHLDSKMSQDACSLVCKRWLMLQSLGRRTIHVGASVCLHFLIDLLAGRFINVRNLFIDERLSVSPPVHSRCYIGDAGLAAVGQCHLSELSLLYCKTIDDNALSEIGRRCKYLQALHLVTCSIGDDAICSIARGCRNLKKLHIVLCHEVGNEGIIAVGQNCKFLTDLSLRYCYRVGDEALISIGEGCSLQRLQVNGCHEVGDAGITAIARGCPQLSYLDVSRLQNLGDIAMEELSKGCPLLTDIVLSICYKITDEGLSYLVQKCTLLETCHMVECPGITAAGVATVIDGCLNMKKVLVENWKVSERTKLRAGSIISYR